MHFLQSESGQKAKPAKCSESKTGATIPLFRLSRSDMLKEVLNLHNMCNHGQSAILQRDHVDLSKGEEPSSAGSRSVRIISN